MTTQPVQTESSDSFRTTHILSFDVEEYFHAEAIARGGTRPRQWDNLEKRLMPCIQRILQLLSDHGASATFFILGWVARHEPEVVGAIAEAGHEIASHGMGHAMLQRIGPENFLRELLDSRKLLEDIASKAVIGYRAPTFSVTHDTAWAIDVLAAAGYEYDSSVFPIRHDRYGVPDAPRFIHTAVGPGGGQILEFPPLTMRILGNNLPVGGGGYFRLLPLGLLNIALNRTRRIGQTTMLYLHPWELDPGQPVMPMGKLSRWRHRVNLGKTAGKLDRLLGRFNFTSVAQSLPSLSADVKDTFTYGRP